MKQIKNEQGYALLVVLLMVVLFLGLSAVFMAGSMNNAKQETTVDTSNLAVASAEMGVKYFSTDFQRDLKMIEEEVWTVTQVEVNKIIACADTTECDEESEILARTNILDEEMKDMYIKLLLTKVNNLTLMKDNVISPFSEDLINYSIESASAEKLNSSGNTTINDSDVTSIRVNLGMNGTSGKEIKKLNATFLIEVPETYLDSQELLVVKTIVKDDLEYKNIFPSVWPNTICTNDFLSSIVEGDYIGMIECKLGADQTVHEFIKLINNANLNPTDFRVYASNFEKNVCTNNCNNLDFEGIAIVAYPGEGTKNGVNNMDSANLMIDGHFEIGNNFNNLSGDERKQTIVLKELKANNNIQNMDNTNLVILGNETGSEAQFYFKNNISLKKNSKVCIDIDRIKDSDLTKLAETITLENSSYIIYYTRYPETKKFELPDKERTDLYVQSRDTYATFLSTCGVSLTNTIEKLTDLPIPNTLDPDFDLDVEY